MGADGEMLVLNNCFLSSTGIQTCVLLLDVDFPVMNIKIFATGEKLLQKAFYKLNTGAECFAVMNVNLYQYVSEENIQGVIFFQVFELIRCYIWENSWLLYRALFFCLFGLALHLYMLAYICTGFFWDFSKCQKLSSFGIWAIFVLPYARHNASVLVWLEHLGYIHSTKNKEIIS